MAIQNSSDNEIIVEADDINYGYLNVQFVPRHMRAGFAPIRLMLTDETMGNDVTTVISIGADTARHLAAVLLTYANRP